MSGKSRKCQRIPFSHKNARELSGKFGPILQCQGQNLSEIDMVERSKEYQINNERNVCLTCQFVQIVRL